MRVNKKYVCSLLLGLVFIPLLATAGITLPPQISDNAILQRDQPIPVWGTASPMTKVTVTLATTQQVTTSDAGGNWLVTFPAREAGGPVTLVVQSGEYRRQASQLMFGDVWVCSGQSNMEWPLRNAENAQREMAAANFSQIRHFKVPNSWARQPAESLASGNWRLAVGEQAGDFTAVGYFFAKRLQQQTDVPIGLMGSNWGGSRIEPWMSAEALGKTTAESQKAIDDRVAQAAKKTHAVKQHLLKAWPGALVDVLGEATADWSGSVLDTHAWETLTAPTLWEQQGYPEVDGVMWYRKAFHLSDVEAAQPISLSLGMIDDNDITWVNGHQVGSTNAYDVKRRYSVDPQFLKAGNNTIAIRVEDTGGGGGLYGDAEALYVETRAGERYPLAGDWRIRPDKLVVNELSDVNQVATALYNKMLYPLFRTPVKGVIWYQGESNANTLEDARAYTQQFQRLINDWRQQWQQPELPFYWVQLANFNSDRNSAAGKPWAILREAQSNALSLPHTGQAVILDVGNPDDIHPRDKQTVGNRLANIALYQTYGKTNQHYRGPVFDSVKAKGNTLSIHFKTPKALHTTDGAAEVKGFEIADKQGTYHPVVGVLSGGDVIIKRKKSKGATALRYAWDDNPLDANLMDSEGLPAESFRVGLE